MISPDRQSSPPEVLDDESVPLRLPARLRLLCLGGDEPSWISLTLQLDACGCTEPAYKWVTDATTALAMLREDSFDCILVCGAGIHALRAAPDDPFVVVRALRASGSDEPVVLILSRATDATWGKACDVDADLIVSPNGWESLAIVPVIRRAIDRVRLQRDNHQLANADRRRLSRERIEAEELLNQQRQMIEELEQRLRRERTAAETSAGGQLSGPTSAVASASLPPEVDSYYQELLRTYVIMGAGSLGAEIAKLADLLSFAGMTPRQVLELHLARVEELVRGLGNRSTRHVMARADLLALELMMHLGECYQRRCLANPGSGEPGPAGA